MPQPIAPISIAAYTATTAAGVRKRALLSALREHRSALTPNDFGPDPLPTWIGRVAGLETMALPAALADWDCRNNRLAWLGLQADGFIDAVHAARERHGAARVAVVLGTSTSSIGATEDAYRALDAEGRFPEGNRNRLVHTPHSLANFVQHALALEGPCVTISTACSSSAKVFASAERMLRLGLVDAAVVGGVDTLCGSVLFGFNALQLVSPAPCRPFDAERDGISLGEAAGFALLERCHDEEAGRPPGRPEAGRAPSGAANVFVRVGASICWATANRATPTTCRRRTREASAPSALSTTRWLAPASTRARSITSTCMARRARRTTRSRPP